MRYAALLHHAPAVHHQDLIAQARYHAQIMGDQQDGNAHVFLQLAQQCQDLGLHRDVQCGSGLVGQQDGRFTQQGHGQHHALAHASGKLMRVHANARGSCWNLHCIEHTDGAGTRGLAIHAFVQLQGLSHLALNRQVGVERSHRVLKGHRNLAAAYGVELPFRKRQQIAALVVDAAGGAAIARQQAHDGQRCLRLA